MQRSWFGYSLAVLLPVLALITLANARPALMPDINARQWLNSQPLSRDDFRGRVVMVEFWTYGCYNCQNVEPFIREWHKKYQSQGLLVIGVHSPEFEHEKDVANVRAYVKRKDIQYPVAMDNDMRIWRQFHNRYWPAIYLIDKKGRLRYHHFGEGAYGRTEQMIQRLLAEP